MFRRRGFTLIELLVVIGIIALLLSLLVPAVNRVRFNAKCALCAANLRQFSAAMSHYAMENSGWFPSMTRPGAGNAYDLDPQFCTGLLTGVYRIPTQSLYCPVQEDSSVAVYTNVYGASMGYMTWIPGWNNYQRAFAPPLIPGTGGYIYPMPLDPTPFAGPQRLTDPAAKGNPLFTDFVRSEGAAPSTARAGDPGNPYSFASFSNHFWRDRIVNINAAFADGHVEAVMGDDVRPRYGGNALCWR
jgi:prepilin-type N-terminal cleavage/methylation domain-containing protein/prepilin-type processing-associated H-X9-DG protein